MKKADMSLVDAINIASVMYVIAMEESEARLCEMTGRGKGVVGILMNSVVQTMSRHTLAHIIAELPENEKEIVSELQQKIHLEISDTFEKAKERVKQLEEEGL